MQLRKRMKVQIMWGFVIRHSSFVIRQTTPIPLTTALLQIMSSHSGTANRQVDIIQYLSYNDVCVLEQKDYILKPGMLFDLYGKLMEAANPHQGDPSIAVYLYYAFGYLGDVLTKQYTSGRMEPGDVDTLNVQQFFLSSFVECSQTSPSLYWRIVQKDLLYPVQSRLQDTTQQVHFHNPLQVSLFSLYEEFDSKSLCVTIRNPGKRIGCTSYLGICTSFQSCHPHTRIYSIFSSVFANSPTLHHPDLSP